MSYLVLARKYRPKTFDEVSGQELVKRVLRGAIEEQRIGHAYLFTGPRGTGKTTTARLFAKALNCELGPTINPCGTCERCLALEAGAEVDVIEIDAASNTGVDDVRKLREQAGYVPMRSRFKIYIVDEVHMLSKPAFNALLKTLEEPPPHVKFLFATTELHKVLDTILSRCQVLKLTTLSEELIIRRLEEVFAAEGVKPEAGVTAELARRARGGMRDALSLADQLLALVGNAPTLADAERLSGDGSEGMGELIERLIAGDKPGLMGALPDREGGESELVSSLLDHLRACLLAALCGADTPMLQSMAASEQERQALRQRGQRIGPARLELWLQELLHARERMRLLPTHGRLVLEITLLDLCDAHAALPLAELAERLERLEGRLTSGAPAPAPKAAPPEARVAAQKRAPQASRTPEQMPRQAPEPAPQQSPRQAREPARAPASAPGPAPGAQRPARVRTNSTADAWAGFLLELKQRAGGLGDLIERRGSLVQYGSGKAVVRLDKLAPDEIAMVSASRNRKLCNVAFEAAVGQPVVVDLQDASAAAPGQQDAFTAGVKELFKGRIEN